MIRDFVRRSNARYFRAVLIAGPALALLLSGCHVAAKLDFCGTLEPDKLFNNLSPSPSSPAGNAVAGAAAASRRAIAGHECVSDVCPFETFAASGAAR